MSTSGEQMGRQAEEMQARLRAQGRETQQQVRQGAESMRENVATGLHTAAQRLRQQGQETGRTNLTSRVAEPLDRGAQYLGSHSWPQIGDAISRQARERPLLAAAGVFAAAFLLGRILRRR